jgi:hypothetical protein
MSPLKQKFKRVLSRELKDGRTLEIWQVWSFRMWIYELGIQGKYWEPLNDDNELHIIKSKFDDYLKNQ